MARNGTWLIAFAALAALAAADETLLDRWDKLRRESFDMKGAWPEHVVEGIATRFGVPFELEAADIKRADFVVKDATFFEALDAFARLHRLGLVGVPGGTGGDFGPQPLKLVLVGDALPATPVCHAGPTRLSVQSVSVVTERKFVADGEDGVPLCHFGEEPGGSMLRLRLRWLVEPGFDGLVIASRQVTASDDRGHLLKPLDRYERPARPNADFDIDLAPPPAGATSIGIKVTLKVALPVEKGTVEFQKGDVGQTKQLGGARLKLEGIDEASRTVTFSVKGSPCPDMKGGGLEVKVGTVDWGGFLDTNPLTMLPYDADGKEIGRGNSSEESTNWFGRQTFKIQLEAVPTRIAFESLVRGAVRELAFSFTDIPLPK